MRNISFRIDSEKPAIHNNRKKGDLNFAAIVSIDKFAKTLQSEVSRDRAFTKEDMAKCALTLEFADLNFFGLWLHKNRINPSLSFTKIGNEISFYETNDQCQDVLKLFECSSVEELKLRTEDHFFSDNYVFLPAEIASQNVSKKAAKMFLDCASLICRRSSNSSNITISLNRRIYEKISAVHINRPRAAYMPVLKECLNEFTKILNKSGFVIILSDEINVEKLDDENAINSNIISDFFLKNVNELNSAFFNFTTKVFQLDSLNIHLLVQPVTIGGEIKGNKHFICLWSKDRFTSRDIINSSYFSSTFEEVFKRSKKLQLLVEVDSETRFLRQQKKEISHTNIRCDFTKFLNDKLDSIFSLVRAHSMTLRMYDPIHNGMISWVSRNAKSGASAPQHATSPIINLSKFRDSVNAFTFLVGTHHFEYVYLRNLNKSVPLEYREKGLYHSLKTRDLSKSELCVPFRFGSVTVGTMNFESGQSGGFDEDIDFLISLKNALEKRYAAYFDHTDVEWLRNLTRFADPLHELSNYLASDIFNKKQKDILKALFFGNVNTKDQVSSLTVGSISFWFREWVFSYFDKETDDVLLEINDILVVNDHSETIIGSKIFEIIKSIIRNLIINIVNYSFVGMDKIIISADPRYQVRNTSIDYLRVRFKTFGIFSEQDLEVLCLRPIKRNYDMARPEHYGMYTLGLLVRSVGGYVTISENDDSEFTIIEFTLPTGTEN